MASAGAVSIRTFVPADFDQCINLFADGMNYYSQSNGYEEMLDQSSAEVHYTKSETRTELARHSSENTL